MTLDKNIPARPFFLIVSGYAKAKGIRFFSFDEQCRAIRMYVRDAAVLN